MKSKRKSIIAAVAMACALCAVGLSAFAADPLGSKDNPWDIGTPTESDVEAWTNGMGRLDIDGTGAMMGFSASSPAPWADASFTEAVVGSNVTVIGANAFKSCPNLKTLVLNEQTPPTLGAGNDFSKANKIFVPAGKADAYRASEGWKAYEDAIEEMCSVKVDALSNKFALDLTVGDRVAKDVEPLVIDPAWDEDDPTMAAVSIDGEDDFRRYTSACIDTWETGALEPGRYEVKYMTSCVEYPPTAFWVCGDDWVIFDSSNITADVTFQAGKTYLFFGTNTVDATLKVEDGAKFFYDEGAPAGFKGGTVTMSKRYGKETVEDGLYQIVEKIKGCENNPWDIGEGVTAYTNGTELVIGGEGTVADLSEISDEVKGEVESLTIATNGVTGVASEAFDGVGENGMVALTLPDGWQGELPDESGNWYGARNVSLMAYPLAVKNVTFAQRYPWNGKIDIGFDVTGSEGEKTAIVTVRDGATEVTNFTAAVTIPADGVLAANIVWDATTAGLAADFKSDAVTVEVALVENAPNGPVQLWENGPYFAACNIGANAPQESGYYFWWGDTTGYVRNGSSWDAADESKTGFSFASENCPTYGKTIEQLYNDGNGYIDANSADGKLKPAYDAATAHLGAPWRMMTKDELELLTNTAYCVSVWTDDYNETGVAGRIVTGVTEGYTDKSIFLPAAGVGSDSDFYCANSLGFFWSSTPSSDYSDGACALNLLSSDFNEDCCNRSNGTSVRPVRDTPPEVAPAESAISAKSAVGTVDLRTNVALAEGETTVSNVTWSATLWGELDEEFVTAIGWTNLTTGATGVFSNLARVVGEAAEDVDLPKKNGEYQLTHSTGDLTSFVTFVVSGYPLGCETNPWKVGPKDDPDSVIAWTDGAGTVYFQPPRSSVSREGLETITNAMGGASFLAKLISEDGSATNDLVMAVGAGGAPYDTIADALASGDDSFTLFDVTGCVVNYDGRGHSGTMAPDTFLPGIPTNLTANAYRAFGYEFQGWTTNGDTEVVFEDMAEIADPQPGDVYDLKAVWKFAPVAIGAKKPGDVIAYLDTNGTLHIEGDGAMKDFTDANPAPWAEFAPDIKAIEVEEGVTKIGNAAFDSLDYAGTTTALTFQGKDHVLNLLAFVSADGSKTNAPLATAFSVYKDSSGTVEPIVAFQTPDQVYVYTKAPTLMRYGYDEVLLLTLPDLKAVQTAELIEAAGELPYSKTMQGLLDEALDKIDKATNYDEVTDGYVERLNQIKAQAEKDKTNEIAGTDITWRVMDGVLYIDGDGEMPDFVEPDYAAGAPWDERVADITSAEVAAGITSVGDAAFAVCPANGEASVLFEDPALELNLGAFVSGDGSATNVPTVKVEIVTDDGRTLRVVPGGWTNADDQNVTYDSLAEAIEDGATAVKAAFEKKTDEGEKAVPPVEVEEVVKTVTDESGDEIELTAKFVNDANGLGSDGEIGLATDVENIAASVDALSSNIVVTVKLESSGTMDAALSNACETVKAGFAPDAATLGFVAHNFDIDVAWSFDGDDGELTELPYSIVAHIPMKVYDGLVYSVSRIHAGAFETLPEWTEETVDSDTAEWFKVDVAKGEIVIKTRLFCPYAIGVLELEKTCTVVVGNGDKYVGDRDPVSLPTNFTLAVTGPLNLSEFAGYAKRAAGESAGEYAINFVCVKMPAGFPEAGFDVQPGVFAIEDRPDHIAPTGKVTYAKASKGNILVKGKPATWKAKPGLGCTFAKWSWIGEGDEPAGFKKLSENERRNKKLTFTVGKKEAIHPKDFEASFVRIDEDTIDAVEFVQNASGAVTGLAVDTVSYVTAKVKGLPAGLKFNAKKLKVTGKPTKNGAFTATVTVKNASGYSWTGKFKFTVAGKQVTAVEALSEKRVGVPLMLWCDTKLGSVKTCGVFKPKATRKVVAKAKKGYVFAGWYEDPGFSVPATFKGGADYRTASVKIVMKSEATYLFARFLPKTTTADPITWLRYAGAGYCGAPASFLDEQETWYQGVKLPTNACQIAFTSASLPTVTVKGLPKGVTFDKKTLRFKGVPTKSGKFTVKVTVKNKSAATDVLTRKVVVKALPKWLVGTYDGVSFGPDGEAGLVENGIATVTVGSTGKISGKTVVKGKTSSFKASSFANVVLDGEALVYVSGTKTFAESEETGLGEFVWTTNGVERAWAVQRGWSRQDLALPLPVFPTGKKALKLTETADDGSVIKLSFGSKGAVTVAGKVPGKGGKLVAISGSSRVIPTDMTTVQDAPEAPERLSELFAETCVNIAPTKTVPAGFCAAEPLVFTVNSSNKATAVANPAD